MLRFFRVAVLSAPLLLLSGCGFLVIHGVRHAMSAYSKKDDEAVEAALARYRESVLAGKTDQLPDLFDPSGELSRDDQPAVSGRAALAAYFKSSAGTKVVDYELKATSTSVSGDQATQKGRYREKVVTPAGQTVSGQGTFDASWSRQSDGRWLLHRLHTTAAVT